MGQTNRRDAETRALIRKTARIHECSESLVEKVIKGDRNNEDVMTTYMELLETGKETENALKVAVMEAVPFETPGNTKVKIQQSK